MDVLEEYAREASQVMERGEIVEPIPGMHFYVLEEEYIPIDAEEKGINNYWLFANRKSADASRLQRMYGHILERIQYFYSKESGFYRDSHANGLSGLRIDKVAATLSEGRDLHGVPNPMSIEVASQIAAEIYDKGNSETLRQWFLTNDVEVLKTWYGVYLNPTHGAMFKNQYYVFDSQLDLDYSRISDAQIWGDAPELLRDSRLWNTAASPEKLSKIESEEEIRVAMLLGAQIDALPGMVIYLVNKHKSDLKSGAINLQSYQSFFYATSEESAWIARTIYQFDQLERSALFVSGGRGSISGSLQGAVHWMESHKIANLEKKMIQYQRSQRRYFHHARIKSMVLAEDFILTYESLKDIEKVLVP